MGNHAALESARTLVPTLLDSRFVHAHDVRPAYGRLRNVVGLGRYSERALVLPGTTIVEAGLPSAYLRYLYDIGIRDPDRDGLIRVQPGRTLLDGLTDADLNRVRSLLLDGYQFSCFMPTRLEEGVLERRMGLRFHDYVWGPRPSLAADVNNKIWLRIYARKHHLGITFADYHIAAVNDKEAILHAAADIMSRSVGVVVKNPGKASGEGMAFIDHGSAEWAEELLQAVSKLHAEDPPCPKLLIEEWHPEHTDLSSQLEIGPDGPLYLAPTINRVDGPATHDGNVLSSGPLPEVPADILVQMECESMKLGDALYELGYRGYFGIDFMYTPTRGYLYCLEVNGRATGAMYPLAVGMHLAGASKFPRQWAVVSANVSPPPGRFDFNSLSSALSSRRLLFKGGTGVLPVCVTLLEQGKAMLYCVGRDVPEASNILAQAEELMLAA
jgi:hypothetical protein